MRWGEIAIKALHRAAVRRRLLPETGAGIILLKGLPAAAAGFVMSGALFLEKPLPLAACLTGALPPGFQAVFAAAGAVLGYALRCDGLFAAEYGALTLLLLAAVLIFRGTGLMTKPWFLPGMASSLSCILGSVGLLGGSIPVSFWIARSLLAGLFTWGFRKLDSPRGKLLLCLGILSGLAGFRAQPDPGLFAAAALLAASRELSAAAAFGLTLDLTGLYGRCALPALVLPLLLCRLLPRKNRLLSGLTFFILSGLTFFLFGQLTFWTALALFLGICTGTVLDRVHPLHFAPGPGEKALRRLDEAAGLLDTLRSQLPEDSRPASRMEAESIYDGAADRICRCCARFSRCWDQRAAETCRDLSSCAARIIEEGTARAEDFPPRFRDSCCHLDGFVTAVNQELDSMLCRRRCRMQLRESRQAVGEELECLSEYLKALRQEPEFPDRTGFYLPRIGISSLGRHGNSVSGDRGACFRGSRGEFFILLCDGMGTGPEAARSGNETIRLLERLLRSGLSPRSALRMMNGMELLRETCRYTTVDLLRADLVSGQAQLWKWGSAPSFLRDGDEVRLLGTAAPPPGVGISREQGPEEYDFSMKEGQILVLVSDGAAGPRTGDLIASYEGTSSRELAALLIAEMPPEDDMTAVVLSLRPGTE